MNVCLSIDVGFIHLAFVIGEYDDQWHLQKVTDCWMADLTRLSHQKISRDACQLHHTNDAFDRIAHLIQEHEDRWSHATHVCIERQPTGGLVHVEQLLFGHFRNQATLVSPNSMHRYFDIRHLDYEKRKAKTTQIARPFLQAFPAWQEQEQKQHSANEEPRLHDMADAFCLMQFFAHKRRMAAHQQQLQANLDLPPLVLDRPLFVGSFLSSFEFQCDTNTNSTDSADNTSNRTSNRTSDRDSTDSTRNHTTHMIHGDQKEQGSSAETELTKLRNDPCEKTDHTQADNNTVNNMNHDADAVDFSQFFFQNMSSSQRPKRSSFFFTNQ